MFSVLGGDGASPLVPTLLKTSSWGPLSLSTTPLKSNWGPFACKANVITATLRERVEGPLIFPPMIQLWTLSVLDEQDNPNSTEERQGEGGLNLMMF
ncbi:unnamed protein product [Clavelina lepadiformis]|uniref:Uncharacterized protein n=1 Tax=Clavelina lepadiformis TaxID=159417 RepID=A0ABP0GH26_CLALP